MGSKCLDCARVARCDKLVPCSKFILFREYIPHKDVALLCGCCINTIKRKLKFNERMALAWIKEQTGFTFRRVAKKDNPNLHGLVLVPNNCTNSVKLERKIARAKKNLSKRRKEDGE